MEANLHLHRLTSDIQLVNVLKFLLNGGKSTLDRRPHILAVFCIDNRAPGLLVRNYGERHSNWKLFLFFQLFKNDPSQINACNALLCHLRIPQTQPQYHGTVTARQCLVDEPSLLEAAGSARAGSNLALQSRIPDRQTSR